MSSTSSKDPIPSDGERNALVGYSAQFGLAAKVVYRYLPTLQWIRVADPSAGVADDFQFVAAEHRHALQVKWSQFPRSFNFSELFGRDEGKQSLFAGLADAWMRLRNEWGGPLTVHLCTNNFPSVTKPRASSVLVTAIDSQRHFAAFLSRSFVPVQEHLRLSPKDGWAQIAALDLVTSWSDAWTEIKDSTGLTENELTEFLRDFDLTFIPLDQSELLSPRDINDQNHLAATLQGVVVDPVRIVELDRSELMARLDWSSRTRYQNPHRFPVPDAYSANSAARTALEEALARHQNGYVALIGPPGSGKSTLVEKVSVVGRLIRYYAFVPDAPDPLNGRGEAQSFLHDLSLALEEAGIHRIGFGADLAGQRAVLFDQLARAGDVYAKDGTRTTIIVDGLDHIPREQNPTRSLLNELPTPAALPLGVCVVLGSQTTSILPAPIREALDDDSEGSRLVEVPPLANDEVESIATMAGVADWMLPGQVSDLVEISEGHPLVLTYMIQDLRNLETEPDEEARRNLVDHMLTGAAEYRGSIDQRYNHYLGSLAKDDDVFAILGTVCRLRISVNLRWLETWVEAAAVTRFADLTHTFFRREGNEWSFIHNSFRRFLVDQTAMVGGQIRDSKSRQLHERLAAQCAGSVDWPQYRDEELAQRYLAGQFQHVLNAATPAALRTSLFAGRPYGVVRDQAVIVLRAAAEAPDYRAMNRSLMFLNELNQRDYVIDADTMASAMSYVDPGRVVEHVVQGRSLRIKTSAALEIAAGLAANYSLESAESIVRAVGGLQGITSDLGRSHARPHEFVSSVADWAEICWHRSGIERVLDELDHILPFPEPIVEANSTETNASSDHSASDDSADDSSVSIGEPGSNPAHINAGDDPDSDPAVDLPEKSLSATASDPGEPAYEGAAGPTDDNAENSVDGTAGSTGLIANDDREKAEREAREAREERAAIVSARNAVHARCYDLADSVRDGEVLSRLAERINAESSPDWRARMHVVAARTASYDADPAEVLRQVELLLAIERPSKPESFGSSLVEAPISTVQQPDVDACAAPASLVEPVIDFRPVVDVDHSSPSGGGAEADDADNMEADEEEATPARWRLSLNLRVAAANALAMSGQAHANEFRDLLPPDTRPAWPNFVGSSNGLEPYRTIRLVLRMRELHHLIGIYDALPLAGLEVPGSAHDPARTRFVAALTIVAQLEARAIASSMGLAEAPDVPALAEPVIRLLELPHTTTRDWTGWYQISDAGIELIAGLVPLAYRCGGAAQIERLLTRFKTAWDNPHRATYWPASRRVAVIRAAAAYGETTEWCRTELDEAEVLVVDEGDPHGRATTWLEFAKARTDIADQDKAIAAVEHAHREGWGPGQHAKDHQLVAWLSWLTEAADSAVIDQATFLKDACTYAARLLAATGEADRQASEAAGNLIIAVFQRDAGLATNMAETLCDSSVIAEPDAITAVLRGAAQRADVDPELVASLVTELLMPLIPDTPRDLEKTLSHRCTNAAASTERFALARALWSVSDSPTASDDAAAPVAGPAVTEGGPVLPLATILSQMRSHSDRDIAADTAQRWSHSIQQFTGSVSRAVAVAVLEQVERLQLGNLDMARAAGIASRAGATDTAREALSRILARTTPYGWQRNWDGGSRIQLFEAAIRDSTDDLVDLAVRDLVGLVASKTIAAEFLPQDLKRFAELFGGARLVAQCWADICDYLDVFAPASDELKGLQPTAVDNPERELITWTAQHLGQPIRIIDFGVRRVLVQNYARHRIEIDRALAESVAAGGWRAEAALHVLVKAGVEMYCAITETAATLAIPAAPSAALISALQDAAVSDDAINRHLASQTLTLNGLQPPRAPTADLSPLYGIELPHLPIREIPELDRRGVPFIDTSNPQQVIAPYDGILRGVAGTIDIDARTLYYRAASLGQAKPDRWTEGGHNAHFERLSRRGTRHVYRPWAYTIGRRGCARVLAELIDARVLPHGLHSPWFGALFDETLNWIAPDPLDSTTPPPWRAPASKDYASEEWCDQAQPAAEHYAAQCADNHVLSENSVWRWLTWETPEEIRRIRTRHGKPATSTLFTADPAPTREATGYGATDYPALPDLTWSNEELVVHGRPYHSDSERVEWLALHPAVADALGWTESDTEFEWIGNDGKWRVRSVFRVRGQLSHRPPSKATCAQVCQVVLSDQGWSELAAKFINLERTVKVNRILEKNQRKLRGRLEKNATATIADTGTVDLRVFPV